jgi:PST family polysaccharide transporter
MGLVAEAIHRVLGGGFVGLAVAGVAAVLTYLPFVWPLVAKLRGEKAGAETVVVVADDGPSLAVPAIESV